MRNTNPTSTSQPSLQTRRVRRIYSVQIHVYAYVLGRGCIFGNKEQVDYTNFTPHSVLLATVTSKLDSLYSNLDFHLWVRLLPMYSRFGHHSGKRNRISSAKPVGNPEPGLSHMYLLILDANSESVDPPQSPLFLLSYFSVHLFRLLFLLAYTKLRYFLRFIITNSHQWNNFLPIFRITSAIGNNHTNQLPMSTMYALRQYTL